MSEPRKNVRGRLADDFAEDYPLEPGLYDPVNDTYHFPEVVSTKYWRRSALSPPCECSFCVGPKQR